MHIEAMEEPNTGDRVVQSRKPYEELTEAERVYLGVLGSSNINKDDYADYVVKYTKKGTLIKVTPGHYTDKKSDEIEARSDYVKDATEVLVNKGDAKSIAIKKLKMLRKEDSQAEPTNSPWEEYLQTKGLTLNQVTKASGVAQTTLQQAAKETNATQIGTRAIMAVAKTLNMTPGAILDDLVVIQAEREATEN